MANEQVCVKDKASNYIKSDCYRYVGKFSFGAILKLYFSSRTFRWQVAFRLCNGSGIAKLFGLFLWKFNSSKSRIQIPRETKVGYGLYIGHGGYIVVNPTAVIGNNCNLSQFITIGSNHHTAAVVGDNVYIGPNVCLVENVKIGNNTTIGAGSVVTKDIPENATAAGNYAKVLHYNNPGQFIYRKWPAE